MLFNVQFHDARSIHEPVIDIIWYEWMSLFRTLAAMKIAE